MSEYILRTSTRDFDELRDRLQMWLGAEVADLTPASGNGMSSETVLFTLDGTACVARLTPLESAMPIFRSYDLARQFQVMRLVRERSAAPVPTPLRCDADIFVMERVDGEIPPDVMPYNFGSWLSEAAHADRSRLQAGTLDAIVAIHQAECSAAELDFLQIPGPEATPLRRHFGDQVDFYRWVARSQRVPIIERGLTWLEEHWPANDTDAVISWGDARIGNIVYRDFTPVAVLDWEMAAVGPRELDLGWLLYHHRFFEDLATLAGLPGLPDFLRRDDIVAAYESSTGYTPVDLDFYVTYAAIRNAIVMARMAQRQIYLGDRPAAGDPDDLLYDRPTLEALLAGTYDRWD